jgi:hypothetical protein
VRIAAPAAKITLENRAITSNITASARRVDRHPPAVAASRPMPRRRWCNRAYQDQSTTMPAPALSADS